jgi:DNA (cytosine-5)-methyltransferase 1
MKNSARPIAIDLFSGVGGMSLGFEQAGFDIVAAVEIDPIHAAAHKFNFPECAILPRSIVGLSGKEIRRAAGLGSKAVDCVFGGPPCQGFSLIGHRSLEDPRNSLVLEFVRLVSELDARYFVFENVKGLTVGRHRAFLEELIAAFDSVGYAVRVSWRVLDAADYAVPQHRERLILFGARKGLQLPDYPSATATPADEPRMVGDPHFGPTCKSALSDLRDADQFAVLLDQDSVRASSRSVPSSYAREMKCMTHDAWHYGYPRVWDKNVLTSSARTIHTDISRRRFKETPPGTVEPISRLFKLAADGLSNTLRAGTDGARGAFTSPRPIHFEYQRCVTVREMARLHGFPDWFRFHFTKWHGARQIGNAVPPPLARAIASQVVSALGKRPRRPRRVIELGDPALLGLELGQAASYFGIPKPISKRDRKSGAKKRKQHEIELALTQKRVANG